MNYEKLDPHRQALSAVSVGFAIALTLAIVAFCEMRLRMYVDYPWLHDRALVMEKLETIDNRLRRFEAKVFGETPSSAFREVPPAPVLADPLDEP